MVTSRLPPLGLSQNRLRPAAQADGEASTRASSAPPRLDLFQIDAPVAGGDVEGPVVAAGAGCRSAVHGLGTISRRLGLGAMAALVCVNALSGCSSLPATDAALTQAPPKAYEVRVEQSRPAPLPQVLVARPVEGASAVTATEVADNEIDSIAARSAASPGLVKALLHRLGFEVGDGAFLDDAKTLQAIRDLQKQAGLRVTGELDVETQVALLDASLSLDRRVTRSSMPGAVIGSHQKAFPIDEEAARRTAPIDALTWTPGPGDVTPEQLQEIWPGLEGWKAREVAPHLNRAMAEANINTPVRKAAFLAQLAHESGGFQDMEERASGKKYEGRKDLGNTRKGDGVRFKGRGFIQVTGRANYTSAKHALGEDFVGSPELAATLENAARIAAWYWNTRGLNALADDGDFEAITIRIRGGKDRKSQREQLYVRASEVLKDSHGRPSTGVFVDEAQAPANS